MTSTSPDPELDRSRVLIGRRVRELRVQRGWRQAELSERLRLSQGRLSEIERGVGSFTAEQFLRLLSLFNVPATHFLSEPPRSDRDLQNALARLGALHLRESADVVPSERLDELGAVVREALVSKSSRQITALGPVLVANIDDLNLRKLQIDLAAVGLDRRLAWVVENVLEALRSELRTLPPGDWNQPYRRAELLLGLFLGSLLQTALREASPPDVLDPDVTTTRTLEELQASSSPIARRWGIVTSLRQQDFAEALQAARVDH